MNDLDMILSKKEIEFEEKWGKIKKEWNLNWKYWSNNKRKIHGYPMRRRKKTNPTFFNYYKFEIFNDIDTILNDTLGDQFSLACLDMTKIKLKII